MIDEGERILNQLRRMDFLRGHADIVIGDGGSKDTTGDPSVLKNFAVRALLVKTSAGKQSAQLRMLLDYAIDQGYEGRQYPDHEPEPARHAIRHAADPTTTELFA